MSPQSRSHSMHRMSLHPLAKALCSAGLLSLFAVAHAQEQVMEKVEVISTLPLPGLAQPRNEVPAPVQTATSEDIERSGAQDLSNFMNHNLGSVYVNEIQGNALQMDVNYRGFTASPLLGTPQGLSVYVDGVRFNQAFGDVMSWDLLPKNAIDTMSLVPGSNPLFGLNTLGGALSVQTKSGISHPGTEIETTLGSYGRRQVEASHGGSNKNGFNWFLSGNLLNDDGWRNDSNSDVNQFFGKLGWANASTDINLSVIHADNTLNGNGLQEKRLMDADYRSVYTKPDTTANRSTFFNLQGQHQLDASTLFSGNAYYRRIRTNTFNGDINEESLEEDAVYDAGETIANTPFPSATCIAESALGDAGDADEACNGLINRSNTKQSNYGFTGQVALLGTLAGKRNQFTIGGGVDSSRVSFRQSSEFGYLNPDRSVTGTEYFSEDGAVDISGKTRTWSLYATDTLSLQDNLHLTVSGRYNRTRVTTKDFINPDGSPSSLAGNHKFNRLNPAIGLTWSPTKTLNTYVGYNEGSRTPSVIELGCANENQPCRLPNALAGDPPLNQVVTRTWEAGVRGRGAGSLRWNAGIFRATNTDDLLFVASQQTGFGYFKNFGETRRQGIELGVSERIGALTIAANYTYLDATFQSPETVGGAGNSTNDEGPGEEGNIEIQRGDRIPLIPRHVLKLNADYRVTPKWSIGGNMLAMSGVLARGNENGQHQPDGSYYLDKGKTSGYAIFSVNTAYDMTDRLELSLHINNLFDRRYATSAQLGAAGFTPSGGFQAQPFGAGNGVQGSTFYAPGAPRMVWVGVKYAFDKPVRR